MLGNELDRGRKNARPAIRASRALGLETRREDAQRFHGAVVAAGCDPATCDAPIGGAGASFLL
jgi:hypothetical protein